MKIITLLCTVFLIFSCQPIPPANPYETGVYTEADAVRAIQSQLMPLTQYWEEWSMTDSIDVNHDGVLDQNDLTQLLKEITQAPDSVNWDADINKDKRINYDDAVVLIDYYVEILTN